MEEDDFITLPNGAKFKKRKESNEILERFPIIPFRVGKLEEELDIEAKRINELNKYLAFHNADRRIRKAEFDGKIQTIIESKQAIKYSGEIPIHLLSRRIFWY